MRCNLSLPFCLIVLAHFVGSQSTKIDETTADYWRSAAQHKLKEQISKKLNTNIAKNVIFFLGDGMSIPTVTAARIYSGQIKGERGEDEQLSFEKFPHVGLAKTYCVDRQVADSACTATAYLCGVKANMGTIGVNAKVKLGDCRAAGNASNHVESLPVWAQKARKSTGIVTTTRVTHASPAGAYAHTSHRDHESDADVQRLSKGPSHCGDIASQLILDSPGKHFDVILGGGKSKFLPRIKVDVDRESGERMDGLDLIEIWEKKHKKGKYVTSRDELLGLNYKKTEQILGLFADSHMAYNLEANREKEPSLKEMTEAAIKLLRKNSDGYFLFVEGGRIDHAHHETTAKKALDETVQFSKAIQAAVNLTHRDETLIVVSSDHAHTLSISGYPLRGNDILGVGSDLSDIDHLPYMTLSYANGLGTESNLKKGGGRIDPRTLKIDLNYQYPGIVPMTEETHGGDDVAVYAFGPQAHLFSGVYEQNVIPAIIAYASCIGDDETSCDQYED